VALVEPPVVGLQVVEKAKIVPGDSAVVLGAGIIVGMTALAALSGGCSRAIVSESVRQSSPLRLGTAA
jgi:D-xylulose reductase